VELSVKPQSIFHGCFQLVLFSAVLVAASANAEVVVVVSAQSPVTSLTAAQTARIFLGKANAFPDDSAAVPVDQAEGSAIRNEFYSKVVHKNSSQLTAYWAKIIFTGNGRPPVVLEGDAAVRKAVANNPNAIGYIDKSDVDSSVRVILAP
jgi:ABC-type phosphate transport system substrate-binding protein